MTVQDSAESSYIWNKLFSVERTPLISQSKCSSNRNMTIVNKKYSGVELRFYRELIGTSNQANLFTNKTRPSSE